MYQGTLIIVSHDRDFLTGLTTKTIEFKKAEVKNHIGDVQEFLTKRRIEKLSDLNQTLKKSASKEDKGDSQNKIDYLNRKEKEKTLRKIKNRIEKIEEEIADLESAIEIKDAQLANPGESDITSDPEFFKSYESLKSQLEKKMEEWEEAQFELEENN